MVSPPVIYEITDYHGTSPDRSERYGEAGLDYIRLRYKVDGGVISVTTWQSTTRTSPVPPRHREVGAAVAALGDLYDSARREASGVGMDVSVQVSKNRLRELADIAYSVGGEAWRPVTLQLGDGAVVGEQVRVAEGVVAIAFDREGRLITVSVPPHLPLPAIAPGLSNH